MNPRWLDLSNGYRSDGQEEAGLFSCLGGGEGKRLHAKRTSETVPIFHDSGDPSWKSLQGDELVIDALNTLSLRERDLVYQDLHCVPADIEETSQLIEESLVQLQRELDLLRQYGGGDRLCLDGIIQAELQDPFYVRDESFRLQFLRADDFDAKKAAKRLVRHFQFKLQYFPFDALARDVTWMDLEPEDHLFLKRGYHQQLMTRDRGDRVVGVTINAGQDESIPDHPLDSVVSHCVWEFGSHYQILFV